jgi:hypothetical protein
MATPSAPTTEAKADEKPVVKKAATLHGFVALESFSMCWNSCVLSFRAGERYAVETALRSALLTTDKNIRWDQ